MPPGLRGALSTEKRLTDVQFARLKEEIRQKYSGPQNAGRPLLLEDGLQWQQFSFSPKDMDFLESKHTTARDVCTVFGVPPMLLGIPGDNTVIAHLLRAGSARPGGGCTR